MALTNPEKEEIRHALFMDVVNVTVYKKAEVTAAINAVETWINLAATKTAIGSAIETAAPGKFTNGQKSKIARWTLKRIFTSGE